MFTWAVLLGVIIDITRGIRQASRSLWETTPIYLVSFVTTCAALSVNSVTSKTSELISFDDSGLWMCSVGNPAFVIDLMKKCLSSANETVAHGRTRGGGRCAPQRLPSRHRPGACRRLCKRRELKVALSPQKPPEIHPDTQTSGEDRWPSCQLIIKAASCNIKKWPSTPLREQRCMDVTHQAT